MKEQISNDLNSNSAPIINLSEKQRKEFIISNYLPNLSQYQIITKTIKDKQIKLAPNVNFTNQKDFFIFYNGKCYTPDKCSTNSGKMVCNE